MPDSQVSLWPNWERFGESIGERNSPKYLQGVKGSNVSVFTDALLPVDRDNRVDRNSSSNNRL